MNAIVYQIAKSDFLERSRRSGFLVTILLAIVLCYFFSPPRDGNYVTLVFDHYVGVYNSAWMGTSVAISIEVFFTLIGYYLVSSAIDRDVRTKMDQIIAASPICKTKYVIGKYWSNFAVLSVIVLIMMIAAIVMQFIRGEDDNIHLWAFSSPFLLLVLPLMALVSAVAVWFEIIPWFRGTIGNVVYFVFWFVVVFSGKQPVHLGKYFTYSDPLGYLIPIASIAATVKEQFPNYSGGFSQGLTVIDEEVQTFIWHGVNWTLPLITGRIFWVVAAIISVILASLFFRCFRMETPRVIRRQMEPKMKRVVKDQSHISPIGAMAPPATLAPVVRRIAFLPVLMAELKLMFSGYRWWFAATFLIICLSLVLPLEAAIEFVLPIAWIWPLALWSGIGTRERRFQTEDLMYATPEPINRLLKATWLTGIILGMVMSSGVAVRLMIEGQVTPLLILFMNAVFVSSVALCCGVWSNSGKMFEVLYLTIWFLGPLNKVPVFNFLDLSSLRNAFILSAISAILYAFAIIGRRNKINA